MSLPRLQQVQRVIGVRAGEERVVGTFMVYAFLVGLASSFVQVTSYSLFLTSFDADSLPWVYIGIAVTLTSTSALYGWLKARANFGEFLWSVVAFNVVSLTALWLALAVTGSRWLNMLLPVWHEVVVFLNLMVYWEYCGRLFDIRQGKRLFGAIRSFEFLAGIIGGLGAAVLAAPLGTANILGIACAINLLVLLLGLFIQRRWSVELTVGPPGDSEEDGTASATPWRALLSNRLALLIFAMVAVTILEYYFLDNVFYDVASRRYVDDESFAEFYGTFAAATGLLTWLLLGLVTGPLMSRFGLRMSLQVMPVAILSGAVLAVSAGLFDTSMTAMFWLVVITKLFDDVLTPAFNEGSVNVVYQVLPTADRTRVRSISDGVVYPVAAGLAGVFLLALSGPLRLDYHGLLYGLLLASLLCVLIAWLLPREYQRALKRALAGRRLGSVSDLLHEHSAVDAIHAGLSDPSAPRVLYCLELLAQLDDGSLDTVLTQLLGHPDAQVRREALRRMEQRPADSTALDAVNGLAQSDSDPVVQGQALRTVAHLTGGENLTLLAEYLSSDEPELRRGAMVGHIRSSGIAGILAAGRELMRMAESSDAQERIFAAEVVGDIGISQFYQPLADLLADDDRNVQRAALVASCQLASPPLAVPVIACISSPGLRSEAVAALVAIGEPAVPAIVERLPEDVTEADGEIASRLTFVLGHIGSPVARDRLLGLAESARPSLRPALAEAMIHQQMQLQDDSRVVVRAWPEDEAACIARNLQLAKLISESSACTLLTRGLYQDVDRRRESLISFLALEYPARLLLRMRAHVRDSDAEKRAVAVEMLDNLLSSRDRQFLMPLVDTDDRAAQTARLNELFEPEAGTHDSPLLQILNSSVRLDNEWLICAALHSIGLTHCSEALEAIRPLTTSSSPHVRTMATWTIAQLKTPAESENSAVPAEGHLAMLTPVERVISLKGVSIFSDLPDADLLALSDQLKEREVSAGTPVIEAGDLGTSLYVVISGEVRVHREDVHVATLGEGAVFGELAALDPEPRSATVTTTEDSLLFTLDQETLRDLMNGHPAVAQGIIRVLCRRLRKTGEAAD